MPAYRHLISGAVGDVPHEPGDPVDSATSKKKLDEWLAAGLIEPVKPRKTTTTTTTTTAPVGHEDDE